ncbi:MAG TPA: PRC-barrel domain-containing protein [Terriglobales bacterium]|nr:PRC-barrel domain-containing protein [Terriglobales bacterium]
MSHYSTLQDYQFDADVRDIRGATLYGQEEKKIGKIKDVVFDHDTGSIRYLVADVGHDRKVMLPVNRLFRAAADEDAFETDLTDAELDHLPAFDNKVMESDESWKSYEQLHRSSIELREKAAIREEKRDFEEGPVMHRKGSDRIVTPPEGPQGVPGRAAEETRERTIPAAELFPDRLTNKFTSTTPDAQKLTLVPDEAARIDSAAYGTETLGPRWDAFEENLRTDLPKIRNRCGVCAQQQQRVA